MVRTLKDMSVGESACVVGYGEGGKAYRKKLLSMGLTRGTEFTVTRYAPMGDPVEIQLRGFRLTLRKNEAKALLIEG